MYVKTDYDGCPYITAGKVYEMFNPIGVEWDDLDICIKSDTGINILVSFSDDIQGELNPCPHLNDIGKWTICDKEGNEL